MTALTLPFWARFWPQAKPRAQVQTASDRPSRREPIFIHDAITPCHGETLLSLMLRRELAELEGQGDPD